jgi:hypothetical protein
MHGYGKKQVLAENTHSTLLPLHGNNLHLVLPCYLFWKEFMHVQLWKGDANVCFGAAWDWSLEFRCMHGKYPCVFSSLAWKESAQVWKE